MDRVKSDGLLGFGVRIDDGFLDQYIETCWPGSWKARTTSVPGGSGCHASSRSLPPAHSAAVRRALKCSEAPRLQSPFWGLYRPAGSVGAAGGQALRVKQDMRSGNGQRTKPTFKERAPLLTGRIREEEASKRLGEVPIVEQRPSVQRLQLGGDDRDPVPEVAPQAPCTSRKRSRRRSRRHPGSGGSLQPLGP